MTKEYFRTLLQAFLNTNEPDLSGDVKLIDERTTAAYELYREWEAQDKTAALELAKIKLFDGLEFSVYYFVLELVCKYFNTIPAKTQQEICQKILPECVKIYNRFSFKINIDKSYYKMITSMQRIIKEYCEKNEL